MAKSAKTKRKEKKDLELGALTVEALAAPLGDPAEDPPAPLPEPQPPPQPPSPITEPVRTWPTEGWVLVSLDGQMSFAWFYVVSFFDKAGQPCTAEKWAAEAYPNKRLQRMKVVPA